MKNINCDRTLARVLSEEKNNKITGGIYHKVQIELTYNSNHIEGSCLTPEQTRYIYETNSIGVYGSTVKVDDIVETTNHFECIDMIIDSYDDELTEGFIKTLHGILKRGTSDSRLDWFVVGGYKKIPNEVVGVQTTLPENVSSEMKRLLSDYNNISDIDLDDILEFHYRFEKIHPFQDGNGRVGRLILFKECLKHNIVPFIIDEKHKMYYYRGLKEWKNEKGFLTETCLSAQDVFKQYLDYFKISYNVRSFKSKAEEMEY